LFSEETLGNEYISSAWKSRQFEDNQTISAKQHTINMLEKLKSIRLSIQIVQSDNVNNGTLKSRKKFSSPNIGSTKRKRKKAKKMTPNGALKLINPNKSPNSTLVNIKNIKHTLTTDELVNQDIKLEKVETMKEEHIRTPSVQNQTWKLSKKREKWQQDTVSNCQKSVSATKAIKKSNKISRKRSKAQPKIAKISNKKLTKRNRSKKTPKIEVLYQKLELKQEITHSTQNIPKTSKSVTKKCHFEHSIPSRLSSKAKFRPKKSPTPNVKTPKVEIHNEWAHWHQVSELNECVAHQLCRLHR